MLQPLNLNLEDFMSGILKLDDLKAGSFAAIYVATGCIIGKVAGRLWTEMTAFADPRLMLATGLMQWAVFNLLDRQPEEEASTPEALACFVGSNALVLATFHFSGTPIDARGAVATTLISTILAISGATLVKDHVDRMKAKAKNPYLAA